MTRSAAHAGAAGSTRVRRVGTNLAANAWSRGIVGQLASGAFVPWAHWVHAAYELLPGRRVYREDAAVVVKWRAVRDQVLCSIEQLGLEATVTRTDSPAPLDLGAHYADLAGLVHIHHAGGGWAYAPDVPASVLLADDADSVHARRMLTTHRLVPARGRLASTLREFCGQVDDHGEDRLGKAQQWRDHVRIWTTLGGAPALSVEPYTYSTDPQRLSDEIRESIALNGLPLEVDGPYPGLWSPNTVLAFVRHDAAAAALPAEHTRTNPLTIEEGGRRRLNPDALLPDRNGRGVL